MVLGEKLFEGSGNITGVKVTKVQLIEGVSTEIRGQGRFPNSENLAYGMVTKYPHGIIDATWHSVMTTSVEGDQYLWWGHEKGAFRANRNCERGFVACSMTDIRNI